MDKEFWLQTWANGRLGFHQNETNVLLLRYWSELAVPTGTIFVPLCGKTNDMFWFHEQGYKVIGIELSPIAVEAFFAENQLVAEQKEQPPFTVWQYDKLRIFNGDYFDLTAADLQDVTAVYDRAALVALPPHIRRAYAQKLIELLSARAKMLLICFEYDQADMSGPPFSVAHEEVVSLYDDAFSWTRVRSKDISKKVRFSTSKFMQNVYLMEKR